MERNMKRMLGIGLACAMALGIAGVSREKAVRGGEKSRIEALDLYIEKPESSRLKEVVNEIVDDNFSPVMGKAPIVIEYSNESRVHYYSMNGEEFRRTEFFPRDVVFSGAEVLERKIGKDRWKYDSLDLSGLGDPSSLKKIGERYGWLISRVTDGISYEVKAVRDRDGKVGSLNYRFSDGFEITLYDRDGDCIADKIE